MRFAGKVAVVTGSSAGIGRATAVLMAEEGARVLLHGRDRSRLDVVRASLEAAGAEVEVFAGDLTDPETPRILVDAALGRWGHLDVLVNNAGGGSPPAAPEDTPLEAWSGTLRLNLDAAFAMCRAAVPAMRAAGGGRIVNVASVAGRAGSLLSGAAYTSAKAGLLGLTRHLARQLAPQRVIVNAVAPGLTRTERIGARWDAMPGETRSSILADVPLGRLAEPEEIARAISFLASDEASYIVGATLDVNGGVYMC